MLPTPIKFSTRPTSYESGQHLPRSIHTVKTNTWSKHRCCQGCIACPAVEENRYSIYPPLVFAHGVLEQLRLGQSHSADLKFPCRSPGWARLRLPSARCSVGVLAPRDLTPLHKEAGHMSPLGKWVLGKCIQSAGFFGSLRVEDIHLVD